ncbi:hypothetical protein ACEPAH_5567 [Sanghuangporus vaninii]
MVSRTPLRALPLDCFSHSDNSPVPRPNPLKSSTKRSRSPSAMLSPAKRRILREEGYLASPSFQMKSIDYERALMGSAYCRSRWDDPGSPMLVDSDSNRGGEGSPLLDAVANRTRSKTSPPKIVSPSKTQAATSRLSSNRTPASIDRARSHVRGAPPLMVPRELPPCPDPQSVHYPGFDIHYDTHIELPSTSSRFIPDPDLDRDKEGRKENLAPRRIAKKLSIPFEGGSAGICREKLFSKPQTESQPVAPYRSTPLRTSVAPFAGRGAHSSAKALCEITPGRHPDTAGDKLARRRLMQEEADNVYSDEEDI